MNTQVKYLMDGSSADMAVAASTPEGLADQLHAMLTSSNALCFPNPVDTAIQRHRWRNPFIESKSVLAILESDVGATPEMFLERVLKKLKYKATIKYVHLYPAGDTSEDDSPFDMAKFSGQLVMHLPECKFLQVMNMKVCNFRVESPTIKVLSLIDPQMKDKVWEINCPNLLTLEMQNHTPPLQNFQRALLNCPHIKTYFSHKYWNEEPIPALYLPNCTKFTFRRGDGTDSLKLYLPRVKELTLDSCFVLNNVELLTEGHADHSEWNKAPGSELSKFRLSLKNSNMSAGGIKSLQETGRVSNPNAFRMDRDQGAGMGDAHYAEMHRRMRDEGKDMMQVMNELMEESSVKLKEFLKEDKNKK